MRQHLPECWCGSWIRALMHHVLYSSFLCFKCGCMSVAGARLELSSPAQFVAQAPHERGGSLHRVGRPLLKCGTRQIPPEPGGQGDAGEIPAGPPSGVRGARMFPRAALGCAAGSRPRSRGLAERAARCRPRGCGRLQLGCVQRPLHRFPSGGQTTAPRGFGRGCAGRGGCLREEIGPVAVPWTLQRNELAAPSAGRAGAAPGTVGQQGAEYIPM